jgi:hypothetical protein
MQDGAQETDHDMTDQLRVFPWHSAEPGPEVMRVRDSDGDTWIRVPRGWALRGQDGPVSDWPALLLASHCDTGLIDCTNEGAT